MKTTIQIIDDNVALTTLLAKTLAKFGFAPVVENNPLLAINTARHYLPDLILLDVMMPERDGGRVLADLREDLSLRYIPVVLLTGITREAQALADTGGIRSVILSKPVQLKELLNTIDSQLEMAKNVTPSDEASTLPPLRTEPHTSSLPDFDGMLSSEGAISIQDHDFPADLTPKVDFSFPEPDNSPRTDQRDVW